MKIDLAVYTAVHGYDWQQTSYSPEDLVRYKQGIGKLPDPLMETLPFGGVFNDDNTIVFYRMHMAIKSDDKGRDSLYIVLGRLPKSDMAKVDFKSLFALREFASPTKPIPSEAVYVGSEATGTPPDYSVSFKRTSRGDFSLSEIGTWFANMPGGKLSMHITGTIEEPTITTQFEAPPPPPPPPKVRAAEPLKRMPAPPTKVIQNTKPSSGTVSRNQQPGILKMPEKSSMWQMTILPVILAFLIGCIVGYNVKSAIDFLFVDVNSRTMLESPSQPPQLQNRKEEIKQDDKKTGFKWKFW